MNAQLGLAAEKWNRYPPVALIHVTNNPTNEGLHKMKSQNNYVIYKFTSPSGKSYIGQTKNLKKRISGHLKMIDDGILFHNAIKKHGFENFKQEILKENLTLDEANYWEEKLISDHRTLSPNGYNLMTGGKNSKPSEETRAKLSAARMGCTVSAETRKKLSVVNTGKKQSAETIAKRVAKNTGKKRTAETKKKLSDANKGTKPSENTIKAAIESNTGRKASLETREKMSIKARNPSEETRKKLSLASTGRLHTNEAKAKMAIAATGRTYSIEAKKKMSISQSNRSAETRAKMSASQIGRLMSSETKEKMSQSGKLAWEKRKATAETKKESAADKISIEVLVWNL